MAPPLTIITTEIDSAICRLVRIEHHLNRFDSVLGRRLDDSPQNRQVIGQQIPSRHR